MNAVIDKSVPMPPLGIGNKAKYPWDGMEVGDSFFWPSIQARYAAYERSKHHDVKYETRRDGGGYRIWRVK